MDEYTHIHACINLYKHHTPPKTMHLYSFKYITHMYLLFKSGKTTDKLNKVKSKNFYIPRMLSSNAVNAQCVLTSSGVQGPKAVISWGLIKHR